MYYSSVVGKLQLYKALYQNFLITRHLPSGKLSRLGQKYHTTKLVYQ